jgi:hypothetical protein
VSKSAALVVALAAAALAPAASSADIRDSGAPSPKVLDRSLSMNGDGRVKVRLGCPDGCKGTAELNLWSGIEGRIFDPGAPRHRPPWGSFPVVFQVEEGGRATLRIQLSLVAQRLVERRGSHEATLRIATPGGRSTFSFVRVRAAS